MPAIFNPADLIGFANALADAARPVAMSWFRQRVPVERKADSSPVTIADRETETALRAMIRARFPDHGVYGEEYGQDRTGRPIIWMIDPIDGTGSFVAGVPLFGTLIALLFDGRPVLGLIDMPALGERWVGAAGRQTTCNGVPCRVGRRDVLAEATLLATSPDPFDGVDRARFEALGRAVGLRRFGGDCYNYGLLASGFADLVVDGGMAPYDWAALVPVVEGAGGVITDWSGQPLTIHGDGRVLAAANAALHAQALRHLDGI